MANLFNILKSLISTAAFLVFLFFAAIFGFSFVDPNPKLLTNTELEKKVLDSVACTFPEGAGNEKVSVVLQLRPAKGMLLGLANLSERVLGVSVSPFAGTLSIGGSGKTIEFGGEESLIGDQRKISKLIIRVVGRHRRVDEACLK